jgi:hypothetical protein
MTISVIGYSPSPKLKSDSAFLVGEVDRRPEVVREGAPNGIVAVDRDGELNAEVARLGDDVVDVLLEAELGRVDADHGQAVVPVLGCPGPQVGERAQPVDAGVGPEVDEDDLSAQALGRERVGVEPSRRALERREATFDPERNVLAREAMDDRADQAGSAVL